MSQQQPDLSIIIPTHNRRDLLGKVLNSLATQSYPIHRFEVIVIADACEDDTEIMVKELAVKLPITIRVYSHDERSASLSRNRGVQEARSKQLLLLDDDIVASRDLVAAHMESKDEMQVVLGYSKPVISANPSWWQLNARIWWEDRFREMRVPGYRFSYRDFFSGNVSLAVDLFERVGGFHPAIRNRLEDYELGYRLIKAGARFVHQPSALGDHHDFTNLQVWLNRVRQEGEADVQMSRLHNELAPQILLNLDEVRWRSRRLIQRMAFDFPGLTNVVKRTLFWMARFCEYIKLRGVYWRVTQTLRESHYWRGVAEASGSMDGLRRIIQEAPILPILDFSAPELDLASLPDNGTISSILAMADRSGLRLTYEGAEIMSLAPIPGFESLRFEHINHLYKAYLSRNFLPTLAHNYLKEVQENGD